MNITIKEKNVQLRTNVKEFLDKKLVKIEKHFSDVKDVVALFSKDKNTFTVEITLTGDNLLLRSEEKNIIGFENAIEEAVSKLDSQIKKYKGKRYGKKKEDGSKIKEISKEEILAKNIEAENEPGIVKVKQFSLKPITVDEAIEAMELTGHTFYFFENAETGLDNVVYKRTDGDYGLIEPTK